MCTIKYVDDIGSFNYYYFFFITNEDIFMVLRNVKETITIHFFKEYIQDIVFSFKSF